MFDKIIKALAWTQVAVVPAMIGVGLGLLGWLSLKGVWGVFLGSALALGGLFIGVTWANRVSRKHGSIQFIARVSATPELDKSKPPEGSH